MQNLFWQVFASLDEAIQETIRAWWSEMCEGDVRIETDLEHLDEEVAYLLIIGNRVRFRVDRLADRRLSIISLIYHELAHCYQAAAGRHLPADYHRVRTRYENGAIKMTKRLVEDLRRNAQRRKSLVSNDLIIQLNGVFDMGPLDFEERFTRVVPSRSYGLEMRRQRTY